MNIALIRPPKISGAFEKILIQEPINLLYLASYLKQNGIAVHLWDFEVEPLTEAEIIKRIKKFNIKLAGFTAMTPTIVNAHKIASLIKNSLPQVLNVIGGPHASAIPVQTLKEFPGFDCAVIGEGEIPFLELCKRINSGENTDNIPSVLEKNSPDAPLQLSNIKDLDDLPFPERSMLNQKLYRHIYAAGINMNGKKPAVVFTSRGCPQNCTFCAVKKTQGENMRFRSPENVLAEIKQCKEKYGYNHITFEDTNLTLHRARFLKICAGLKSMQLTWACQTKVNFVDEELLKVMADSGCLKVAFGVESGSQRILDKMKKKITIEQIKSAFTLSHKAGITTCAFFILGTHPDETKDDIKKTEQLLHEIKPDVFQMGIICPYPGTEVYEIMKQHHLIKEIDWSEMNFMHSKPGWGTKSLAPDDLNRLQKKIYLSYLFSPHFMLSTLKKILDPRQTLQMIKLALHLMRYLLMEKRAETLPQ